MTDTLRPQGGSGTLLRRSIRPEDTTLPVLATSSLRVDADLYVGTEYVRCSSLGTDAHGHPALLGCTRGVRLEDGGSAPRAWPGGTDVSQVGWDTTEPVDDLPAVAEEGRQVEMNGISYFGQDRGDGVIEWVALNDATYDAGTLTLNAAGDVTLPRIRPNIAIIKATLDTFEGAATDQIRRIIPTGAIEDGTLLTLEIVSNARTISKAAGGIANAVEGNAFHLKETIARVLLVRDGLTWVVVSNGDTILVTEGPGFATVNDTTRGINFDEDDFVVTVAGSPFQVNVALVTPATTVRSNSTNIAGGGGTGTVNANCNAGEVCTGGGCDIPTISVNLTQSRPNPTTGTPTGWSCGATNNAGASRTLTAYAVCRET
jgi:hypothetical protein